MEKIYRCKILLFAVGMALVWQPSASQELPAKETVTDRQRPALDAVGVRLGGFQLFPQLDLAGVYDNNIFAREDQETDDLIYVLAPRLELESNWGKHALRFGADSTILRYEDNDSEDREDYTIWAEGRVDVSASGFLGTELRHAKRHENRESPDDAGGFKPTEFYVSSLAASYEIRPDPRRLYGRIEGEYRRFNFEDSLGPGGPIDNDDRDRDEVRGTIRLGYAVRPAYSIFVQGDSRSIKYDDRFDDDGFQRDSDGYRISVGTALDFSGKIFGDLLVGYRSDTFDDARYSDVDGFSFGADLTWNISGLTTLRFLGRQSVETTTVQGASAIDATSFALGVDHELLRNLILGLEWNTVEEDFEGIDRKDEVDTIDFSARYLMNRRAELVLAYSYRRRDTQPSTSGGSEFSRDLVSLGVKFHL